MTIKALYPNIAPSLSLDFANVENLDPRITFARASTATYYNGVTTAKAEENLLINSQAFGSTGWTSSQATVASNTGDTTAPDGTSTATKLTATASTNFHALDATSSNGTTTSGEVYTYSVFAKKGTSDFVQLYVVGQGGVFANFDLDAGVVGTNGDSTVAITAVGNGWFRCSMTFTANGTARPIGIALVTSASAARRESWTAAGTEAIYVWGAQTEIRSAVTAYTPTTTQPITNYVPVLLSAANNVARFDHNPVTGESLGLLIEEQRTNLVVRSEEFDNASWTKARATITANTVVAPDGTLTGDKLVANTDSNTHNLQQGATVVASSTNTVSVYMKAGEYTWGSITANNGSTFPSGYYNLATGVVGSFSSGASGSIQSVGNGWYRCTMTFTMASGTTPTIFIVIAEGDNDQVFAGNGFSGIYIWGAQLEAGAFPTSYIKTEASQVTRSADAASMTGANFSSWYRADEGTLYADYFISSTSGTRRPFHVGDGTGNNQIGLFADSGNNRAFVAINNSTQANITSGQAAANAPIKSALGYKVNDIALVGNAATAATVSNALIPPVTAAYIGWTGIGGTPQILNGHIRKLSYYPKRLANAELQALTQI